MAQAVPVKVNFNSPQPNVTPPSLRPSALKHQKARRRDALSLQPPVKPVTGKRVRVQSDRGRQAEEVHSSDWDTSSSSDTEVETSGQPTVAKARRNSSPPTSDDEEDSTSGVKRARGGRASTYRRTPVLNASEQLFSYDPTTNAFTSILSVSSSRNNEVLTFPPGSYCTDILPSNNPKANDFVRSQRCVEGCTSSLNPRRPMRMREHFVGCQVRKKVFEGKKDPLARLCELQILAMRGTNLPSTTIEGITRGRSPSSSSPSPPSPPSPPPSHDRQSGTRKSSRLNASGKVFECVEIIQKSSKTSRKEIVEREAVGTRAEDQQVPFEVHLTNDLQLFPVVFVQTSPSLPYPFAPRLRPVSISHHSTSSSTESVYHFKIGQRHVLTRVPITIELGQETMEVPCEVWGRMGQAKGVVLRWERVEEGRAKWRWLRLKKA